MHCPIKCSNNYTAYAYLNSAFTFTYTLPTSPPDQPDVMIIRSIAAMADGDQANVDGISLAFNILSDINSNSLGCVLFPYNSTDDITQTLSFVSNPQTIIQITKPFGPNITFTLQPLQAGMNNLGDFSIAISFDLIKYAK